VIPPLSLSGPCLTIRRFRREGFSLRDLVTGGTLPAEVAEFLAVAVAARASVLVSGGTGSGKTTTLNALSGAIPGEERIVTIEDAAELRLRQRHVVRLEARPANLEGRGEVTIRQLVRNALRMRPDRIVVGEVRGPEALDRETEQHSTFSRRLRLTSMVVPYEHRLQILRHARLQGDARGTRLQQLRARDR
jgi:pilus assembly protein CpaF